MLVKSPTPTTLGHVYHARCSHSSPRTSLFYRQKEIVPSESLHDLREREESMNKVSSI